MGAQAPQELLYEVRGRVGVVTFNRPQARNALTFGMYDRLAEICDGAGREGLRALVITGAGDKAFAAGTDISQFRVFDTPEQGLEYERNGSAVFTRVENCAVPTIAAIAGACTGGGAGIAACCDLRIATRDLKFGFPIARTLGNCLSAATLARLVGRLGEARTTDLLFTARLMGAEEALAVGLVNEVVPDAVALAARAQALAETIAGHAPLTLQVTKELLRRLRRAGPQVDDEDLVAKIYTSADFREGMDAFLAKRKPEWTGR